MFSSPVSHGLLPALPPPIKRCPIAEWRGRCAAVGRYLSEKEEADVAFTLFVVSHPLARASREPHKLMSSPNPWE